MDNRVEIRLNDDKYSHLQYFSGSTGLSVSAIIRELIPSQGVVLALLENAVLEKFKQLEGVVIKDEKIYEKLPSYLIRGCLEHLIYLMCKDARCGIEEQFNVLCKGFMGSTDEVGEKIAEVFIKWARAKRGVNFYRFELVPYKGKARFNIVIGPDDTDEEIDSLKKQIVKLTDNEKL